MLVKKLVKSVIAASTLFTASAVVAQPVDLDSLLKTLEQGNYQQSQDNQRREAEFAKANNQQAAMLRSRINERDGLISASTRLETQFEENEIKLTPEIKKTLSCLFEKKLQLSDCQSPMKLCIRNTVVTMWKSIETGKCLLEYPDIGTKWI